MLNDIQLLVFDLDGTLIDSTEAICRTFNMTLAHHGRPEVERAEIAALIGQPLHDMFRVLSGEFTEEEMANHLQHYRQTYKVVCVDHTFLHPFVDEVLAYFKPTKKISLATTKTVDPARHSLEIMGLLPYFDLVYGIDSVSKPKPDPEIIFKTLQHFSVAPEHAVMIGDSTLDIEAGRAAGTHTIGVTTGTHQREILSQLHPTAIVDSLHELREYITL